VVVAVAAEDTTQAVDWQLTSPEMTAVVEGKLVDGAGGP
jgi:hypothetical protein